MAYGLRNNGHFLQHPAHGLFAADAGADAIEAILFLESGANGGGRSARALGELRDFGGDVVLGDLNLLAARDLVEDERALDRFLGRLPLAFTEFLPIDVRLHRVDALVHQSTYELFEPPIDFAIDEHGRG